MEEIAMKRIKDCTIRFPRKIMKHKNDFKAPPTIRIGAKMIVVSSCYILKDHCYLFHVFINNKEEWFCMDDNEIIKLKTQTITLPTPYGINKCIIVNKNEDVPVYVYYNKYNTESRLVTGRGKKLIHSTNNSFFLEMAEKEIKKMYQD
jgi:hypothetical protein